MVGYDARCPPEDASGYRSEGYYSRVGDSRMGNGGGLAVGSTQLVQSSSIVIAVTCDRRC